MYWRNLGTFDSTGENGIFEGRGGGVLLCDLFILDDSVLASGAICAA